jgi:2Fe-2S ferredoxin
MPEIHIQLDGGVRIPAEPGESVLAAMQRAGQKIQTVCKGRGMCGACRVLVDETFFSRLTPPSFSEVRLLRYLKQGEANHRLACQILLDETISGLRLTPAPLPIRTINQETKS